MATLTRFVPFRSGLDDRAELQQRLNSLLESAASHREGVLGGSFVPAADLYEDAQRLVLKLEVPGVKPADLDVRVENQVLTIKGQRSFAADEKEENFHRIERRFGSFTRRFTLPQTADPGAVHAASVDGVLTVTIAKKAEAKPRQIVVETGTMPAPSANGSANVEG